MWSETIAAIEANRYLFHRCFNPAVPRPSPCRPHNIARFTCQVYDVFHSPSFVHVVMDYGGQELYNLIDDHAGLNMTASQNIILRLVLALKHCLAHGVVHRDIKPENVLVRTEMTTPTECLVKSVKLCDFGLCAIAPIIPFESRMQHRRTKMALDTAGTTVSSPLPPSSPAPRSRGGRAAAASAADSSQSASCAPCGAATQPAPIIRSSTTVVALGPRHTDDGTGGRGAAPRCFAQAAVASVLRSSADDSVGAPPAWGGTDDGPGAPPTDGAAALARGGASVVEIQTRTISQGCDDEDVVSRERNWIISGFVGSPGFIAPEVVSEDTCDGRFVDLFALGCLLLNLVLGNVMFDTIWMAVFEPEMLADEGLFNTALHCTLAQLRKMPPFSKAASPDGSSDKNEEEASSQQRTFTEIGNMMFGLLEVDPKNRMPIGTAHHHCWLAAASTGKDDEKARSPELVARIIA